MPMQREINEGKEDKLAWKTFHQIKEDILLPL